MTALLCKSPCSSPSIFSFPTLQRARTASFPRQCARSLLSIDFARLTHMHRKQLRHLEMLMFPSLRSVNLRTVARSSAQNASSENLFVKSSRAFDVGDGEKVCDRKFILRQHLTAFLPDQYSVHGRLHFGDGHNRTDTMPGNVIAPPEPWLSFVILAPLIHACANLRRCSTRR
jgi:hypothetical protein